MEFTIAIKKKLKHFFSLVKSFFVDLIGTPQVYEYKAYDFFDKKLKNPKTIQHTRLNLNDSIEIKDVTYDVTYVNHNKRVVVLRMMRYKLRNTVGEFSHFCKAKQSKEREGIQRSSMRSARRGDYRELKRTIADWNHQKVKIRWDAKEFQCPFCKCTFYRDEVEYPEKVYVDKIFTDEKEKENGSGHSQDQKLS